jgi:PD-(D/E)XK endonuclease
VRNFYAADEIDAYAVYCAGTDRCYFFPMVEVGDARGVLLRLGPTRNNQQRCVNWASDFEFAARLRPLQGP